MKNKFCSRMTPYLAMLLIGMWYRIQSAISSHNEVLYDQRLAWLWVERVLFRPVIFQLNCFRRPNALSGLFAHHGQWALPTVCLYWSRWWNLLSNFLLADVCQVLWERNVNQSFCTLSYSARWRNHRSSDATSNRVKLALERTHFVVNSLRSFNSLSRLI